MALPQVTAAYEDCYDFFDKARVSQNGIRILLPTKTQAQHLQFRLHQARSLERRDSSRIYDRSDPRFGKSENDRFRVAIREAAEGDGWWVYIEPWGQKVETVENL